jgi:hypothetical protein
MALLRIEALSPSAMVPFRPLRALPEALTRRPRRALTALAAAGTLAIAAAAQTGGVPFLPLEKARAQGTPGVVEFRWDNNKDYNKLYYFITNSIRLQRSDYYLILRPKDRKTAILKLTITIPEYFDAKLYPKYMKLCRMSQGGMTKRTRCEQVIPADIEVSANGRAIEVFPNTPIPTGGTVGLMMTLFNPFTAGMFQMNALAQVPGELPVSNYLGSWLIEISPN